MQITKTMWLSIALFCITFKFFCGAQEFPEGLYLEDDVAVQPVEQIDPERTAQIQHAAQRLLDAITTLENKGVADRSLEQIAPVWQESLEKLKMAAFGLRDQYAPIAVREQFGEFYDQFLVVSKRFRRLVEHVAFREYDLEAGSEAEERVAQGAKAIVGFLASLDRGNFFKNIEKIQEIYDKEAKIMRKKQLAQEEVARQQQQEHEVAPRDDWNLDENFFNGDYFAY